MTGDDRSEGGSPSDHANGSPATSVELQPARAADGNEIARVWHHGWGDGHIGHVSGTWRCPAFDRLSLRPPDEDS